MISNKLMKIKPKKKLNREKHKNEKNWENTKKMYGQPIAQPLMHLVGESLENPIKGNTCNS